jgi:hypothetical protein
MRGVTALILTVVVGFIVLILIITFLSLINTYKSQGSENTNPQTNTDSFNYGSYLLTGNPTIIQYYSPLDSELCKKLKNAIKNAVQSGKSYKVDEIAYGTGLTLSFFPWPFIGNCSEEELTTDLAIELKQKVCLFKKITSNSYDSDSSVSPYGGISDAAGLSFESCSYKVNRYKSLYSSYIGPDEELDHSSDVVETFYSPDYSYMLNGDYSHYDDRLIPPSIVNLTPFRYVYNGAGRMKIYVGKASSVNGECVYNIYFCPRPAIAISSTNSSIAIFKIFKDLPIYSFTYYLPYYIKDMSKDSNYKDISRYSKNVYYYNYYDVKLDGDYRVETIINAIKEGLYVNVFGKNIFFAQPHWDAENDKTILKSGECWSPTYDNFIKSGEFYSRTRSIRFNCGSDNLCSGELRIKIALRIDTSNGEIADINNDGKNEKVEYISGFISFCDQ